MREELLLKRLEKLQNERERAIIGLKIKWEVISKQKIKIKELEEENKRLKELEKDKEGLNTNYNPTIYKEDAFKSLKKLIEFSTETYSSLWENMEMSDRTLRNFVSWAADDASEKTYWMIWEFFTSRLRDAEEELLRYRAYISAPDPEERYKLYLNLSISYDLMLKKIDWLLHRRIYTIDDREYKASWEYVDWRFTVYKWSELSYHVLDDTNIRIMKARKELYLDWIIEKDSQTHTVTFLKDYTFRSPSAAAEVICWRSVNGWSKWKSEGKTLDELERND